MLIKREPLSETILYRTLKVIKTLSTKIIASPLVVRVKDIDIYRANLVSLSIIIRIKLDTAFILL